MPFFAEKLAGWTSIPDTFTAFFANLPYSFWLDREHHEESPFSIIGAGVPWNQTDVVIESDFRSDLPFDFLPHLVGVVNYREKIAEPVSYSMLKVDRAFVYDHTQRWMYFVGNFAEKSQFDNWMHAALLRLALVAGDSAAYQFEHPAATAPQLESDTHRRDYLRRISLAKNAIADGEVYQLCLTTRLRGAYSGDPFSYFLRLRSSNPAPYSSFIKLADKTIVSISPERSITVSGKRVVSSPIKGTRARGEDPELDIEVLQELSSNPKERAENLMIVDLIRNDLSRVCTPESVMVDSLLEVQSYSTLHQLVSTISGELREGMTGLDALEALTPGGSMTGAPKRRAMELLLTLEDSARGSYSGGIGWIAPNGDMDLGMVIRTAIFDGDEVSIGIGGGITSDSDPEAEHEEIILKAKALVVALGAQASW